MNLAEFRDARDLLLRAESYEEAKSEFKWPRPSNFNWSLRYFDTLAERCTNPALVYVDDAGTIKKVSFQRLKERSNKVANLLNSLGAHKGRRVMSMLENSVELFEIMLGAMKAGCPLIPASTLLATDDIRDRFTRGNVWCIFADGKFTTEIDQALLPKASVHRICVGYASRGWIPYGEVDSQPSGYESQDSFSLEDELVIYFTSGTTARPKLVLHGQGSYPIGHLSTMYWIGLKKGDLHYNISSPGWAKHAWSSLFAVWNAEATNLVYAYTGRFDSKKVLRVIEQFEVNTLCAPPTVWRHLLLEDLRNYGFSLREVVSAGEPLNPDLVERVKSATGLMIREGYGQTETTLQIGVFPGMDCRPGSMGVEAPGFAVDILDSEFTPVLPNEEGSIAIRVKPERPIGLMLCYIDPSEKNREVFIGDWYLTGDLAYRSSDGYFYFIGRVDDVFKSSDYRVSSFELENELMLHPSVNEIAVIASPDSLRGYVPKAFFVLKPPARPSKELASEIFMLVKQKIAPYKRPRIIEFSEELPKTISGKIKRTELRKRELELRRKKLRGENEYFESEFRNKA